MTTTLDGKCDPSQAATKSIKCSLDNLVSPYNGDRLTRDNQSAVKIRVLQGESAIAAENHLLGEFVLGDIPPARKGEPEIEVAFDIDANGIVNVSARDVATEMEQSITVNAVGTLSQAEIDRIMSENSNPSSEASQ